MPEHVLREAGSVAIIDVADSHSRETFLKLLDVAKAAIAGGRKHLLLNMSKLPQINSQAIGLLVLVNDTCETAGGSLTLCSLPQQVGHVLKLAGVSTFFKDFADEASALEALASAAAEAPGAPAPASAPPPAAPAIPTAPDELARASREIVRTAVRSRRHQQVIKFFSERASKSASLDEAAFALRIPRLTAELVLRDLARNEMLVEKGDVFLWQPTDEAERKLAIFRKALATRGLRTRVMAWMYAEEKQ